MYKFSRIGMKVLNGISAAIVFVLAVMAIVLFPIFLLWFILTIVAFMALFAALFAIAVATGQKITVRQDGKVIGYIVNRKWYPVE